MAVTKVRRTHSDRIYLLLKNATTKKNDWYRSISYCQEIGETRSWDFPENVDDIDVVEIYSDYGGGFCWFGTGSESVKMIKSPLDPWDIVSARNYDGMPAWAEEFLKHLEGEDGES